MLKRSHRPSREAFSRVSLGKGRSATEHFSLTYSPSGAPGCAAVVSKKVERRSTGRHLLKRRMLSVMAPYCKGEASFIAYARKGSETLSYQKLAEELSSLLKRV